MPSETKFEVAMNAVRYLRLISSRLPCYIYTDDPGVIRVITFRKSLLNALFEWQLPTYESSGEMGPEEISLAGRSYQILVQFFREAGEKEIEEFIEVCREGNSSFIDTNREEILECFQSF